MPSYFFGRIKESFRELISRIIRYSSFILVFFLAAIFVVLTEIEMNLKIIIITYYLGVYLLIKLRSNPYKCDTLSKDCNDTVRCDYNIANLYSKIVFMLFLFGGILSVIIVFFSVLNPIILPILQKK